MDVKATVQRMIEKGEKAGGVNEVFFVGCGGSLGAFYPAKTFLESEAKRLRTGWINSNEFVHALPAVLGPQSVVVLSSHRGDTPETIKAAAVARERGAQTVGLTWTQDSEFTKNCDHVMVYTFGDDRDVADEKTMLALKIAVEILRQTEGYAHCDAFYNGVAKIDGIVKQARIQVEERARAFAKAYANDSFIYTIGSGASWASAYMQSVCIFMEMQWIHSACIHSGEFFHGPFEITDENIPFVLQIAEGRTRPLDERALVFLKKYAKRVEVLDAKELGLSAIAPEVVDYFNHSLFNNVYNVYNNKLADARNHPLMTRRYMWKVEY